MAEENAGDRSAPGAGSPDLKIDTSVAHPARVYDYWLGGKDNFAADREAAERVLAVTPGLRFRVRANRAFLARAVQYLAGEAGIRQFLDIGTGIPSANNTHEVAQAVAPDSRIVYADNDPIVLAHARALLASGPHGTTQYVHGDVREPAAILRAAADTLDLSQPTALMLLGILHLIQDSEDPYQIVATLMDALPPGSYLAISHAASDLLDQETMHSFADSWNSRGQQRITWRTRDQVARFFADTDLVEPGLVRVDEWHPAPGTINAGKSNEWGAVGRKLGIR